VKYTFFGDSTLDGTVDNNDFALFSNNFNQSPRLWHKGDYNYDGQNNIADFARLSAAFGESGRRGGNEVDRLMPLYIAMLDFPVIYAETRAWSELWEVFAPVEAAYLADGGTLPRSVPEPALATLLCCGALLLLRRPLSEAC
jgi:hypothetical protein